MDIEEVRALRLRQQEELGAEVVRLLAARSDPHAVQISTLARLIAFLVSLHPCCADATATVLFNLGLSMAEQARQQPTEAQLH